MKLRKLLAMTLVVAMTGVLAAGCGSKSEENGTEGEQQAAEGEQQTAEWDATNDITVVSREDGSGTRGAFIELFGIEQKDENGDKVDYTTEDANITNSTEVMMSTVAGNEYAIGYVSLGSLGDSVKAVKIDGAEATEANIKAGTYKVSRPFNIATKDEISDVAQDFINFILSEEGQKVVSENGYISLDDVKPFESNGATGKVVVAGSSSVTPVMEKLKEAYQKVNSGAEIEINQSDSTTGMTSAMSGICDIGMASRELKDEEAQELTSIVIATDGIAVIVNNDSPVDELTSDQVKAIFTGETVVWDEIVK
ncbi:MAG: substrate-binding domain-containing protein [Bariatricus sp.]